MSTESINLQILIYSDVTLMSQVVGPTRRMIIPQPLLVRVTSNDMGYTRPVTGTNVTYQNGGSITKMKHIDCP